MAKSKPSPHLPWIVEMRDPAGVWHEVDEMETEQAAKANAERSMALFKLDYRARSRSSNSVSALQPTENCN